MPPPFRNGGGKAEPPPARQRTTLIPSWVAKAPASDRRGSSERESLRRCVRTCSCCKEIRGAPTADEAKTVRDFLPSPPWCENNNLQIVRVGPHNFFVTDQRSIVASIAQNRTAIRCSTQHHEDAVCVSSCDHSAAGFCKSAGSESAALHSICPTSPFTLHTLRSEDLNSSGKVEVRHTMPFGAPKMRCWGTWFSAWGSNPASPRELGTCPEDANELAAATRSTPRSSNDAASK
jgi:hypothetical protein